MRKWMTPLLLLILCNPLECINIDCDPIPLNAIDCNSLEMRYSSGEIPVGYIKSMGTGEKSPYPEELEEYVK